MTHTEKAIDLFHRGYNCAQSVFAAFCDETGLDEKAALKLSSSFGGGIGRLREICGAASGMVMALGSIYGYTDPDDFQEKAHHYARVQELMLKFRDEMGCFLCRDILNSADISPVPTKRTEEFYKMRPCDRAVFIAAELLDKFIKEQKYTEL